MYQYQAAQRFLMAVMKDWFFLLMLKKYSEALEVKLSSGKWVGIHATSYKEHAIKISMSSRDF